MIRGDVDVQIDAETARNTHKCLDAWIVLSRLETGDGRLLHLELPGENYL